jgi:hypothetical protein
MLHLMYGMTAHQAMNFCQFVHDIRICPVNVGSPQTIEQRSQVRRRHHETVRPSLTALCRQVERVINHAIATAAAKEKKAAAERVAALAAAKRKAAAKKVAQEAAEQQADVVVTPVATTQQTSPQQEPLGQAQAPQPNTRVLWANGTSMPIAQRRHSSGTGTRKHRTTINPGNGNKPPASKPQPAPPAPYTNVQPTRLVAKRPSKTIQQLRLKQAQAAYAQPPTRAQYRLCTGIKRPLNTPNGPNSNTTQQMMAVGSNTSARAKMTGQMGDAEGGQQSLPSSLQGQQNGQQLLQPGVIRPLAPPSMRQAGGTKAAKRPATNVNNPTGNMHSRS